VGIENATICTSCGACGSVVCLTELGNMLSSFGMYFLSMFGRKPQEPAHAAHPRH
jgi:hypothetical protein